MFESKSCGKDEEQNDKYRVKDKYRWKRNLHFYPKI